MDKTASLSSAMTNGRSHTTPSYPCHPAAIESKIQNPKSKIESCLDCAISVGLFLLLLSPTSFAFDVSGSVVDPTGQSVGKADVWLSQDRYVKHTSTDDRGVFVFSEVAAKPTEIVARKEGFSLSGTVVSIMGSGSVTLALHDPDVLRLRIKNQDYEPVSGAWLRTMFIADSFNVPVEDLVPEGFPAIRSDEEGRMTLPELPRGTHVRFIVGHRDYANASVAYLPVGGKEQTILLYPGVKLRGRVTVDDKGVEHARVFVSRIGTGAQRDVAETLTDKEGFYNAMVEPGEYFVSVRHTEYASPKAQHTVARLEPEQNVVNLALEHPRVIQGSAAYPDGKPCSGMIVSYWIGPDLYQEVITQTDGRFRLLTPPVDGRLRVLPPNGYMTENVGDISVTGTSASEINLAPVKLVALPSVDGTVVSPEGKPEPNVLLSSRNLTPPAWAITDAEGRFRIQLAQAPPEGKATFRAEHAERFLRSDFEVSFQQQSAPVTVTLAPFEPDVSSREVAKGANDLSSMTGAQAPEILCDHWWNSSPLTLESLRGKVVVLAFWGGFDMRGPIHDCIEELRALTDLLKSAADVAIVCVHDNGKDIDDIERSIGQCRISFPLGRDNDEFKTYQAYDIHYIPQVVLIDKHGVLRFFQVEGRLLELIKSLRREA